MCYTIGEVYKKGVENMTKATVRISTIQDVRTFVETVTKYNMEIDLSSGRYVVDAKSIMGIFSLDLLNPIELTAHTEDETEAQALLRDLKPFIVE